MLVAIDMEDLIQRLEKAESAYREAKSMDIVAGINIAMSIVLRQKREMYIAPKKDTRDFKLDLERYLRPDPDMLNRRDKFLSALDKIPVTYNKDGSITADCPDISFDGDVTDDSKRINKEDLDVKKA